MVIKSLVIISAYILYPWIPSCDAISIRQIAVRITVSDQDTLLHSPFSEATGSAVFKAVYGELSDLYFGAVPNSRARDVAHGRRYLDRHSPLPASSKS